MTKHDDRRPPGRPEDARAHMPIRDVLRREHVERRAVARGTMSGEPSRARLVSLIVGTYREMPGLQLTLEQAARMFGLRETTCRIVLDDLVRQGRLRSSPRGRFVAP